MGSQRVVFSRPHGVGDVVSSRIQSSITQGCLLSLRFLMSRSPMKWDEKEAQEGLWDPDTS